MKRYRFFFLVSFVSLGFWILQPSIRSSLLFNTTNNFLQMLAVMPPIFLLLGFLDEWIPKDVVIRLMGKGSGIRGVVLSIVLGASSAGPLYGAFPFAAVMVVKGVRLANVVIFLSAWATLKVPMFLFEVSALGLRFAVTRWLLNLPVILGIAFFIEKITTETQQQELLHRVQLKQ